MGLTKIRKFKTSKKAYRYIIKKTSRKKLGKRNGWMNIIDSKENTWLFQKW